MPLIAADIARSRLDAMNAEVHALHVTADRNVIVYTTTSPAQVGRIRKIPALFVSLCVSGGGDLRQTSELQDLGVEIGPGDICVTPPNTPGTFQAPEGTIIAIGLAVEIVAESFGHNWPDKLKQSTFSSVFRDPLVESTLMNIGYLQNAKPSDAALVHAAHMVTHQLLDQPFEDEPASGDIFPLSKSAITRVANLLEENLDRHVGVDEMAQSVGISRHHFSRRFKAATGKSPYQFAIQGKLEYALKVLESEEVASIISIAQRLGYNSPSQFSKLFKKHFGYSPRFWRARPPS